MKALSGYRMLDLTHIVSGPYAGMMLADLGVDTIKIEPPGRGEATRQLLANDPHHSHNGMGAYFLTLNRNKKSMTLDLKQEAGRTLFYELVRHADIVLNNFSAGVMARLKLDYDHLAAVNPRIVTCTITGFGESGPRRDRPAFDMVAQAMSGGMSVTGQPDGPPTRAGLLVGDLGGGLMGVVGILAALLARQQTGLGQHVDISMLDGQISLLTYMATMQLLSGTLPPMVGNEHLNHVPYNAYPTQDGYLILTIIADESWAALMAAVDVPELDTGENRSRAGRLRNRGEINGRLSTLFQTNRRDYWLERLTAVRVPCAPVNNLAEALDDEQVLARNMVVEVEHPAGGTFKIPGNPIKLSRTHEETFAPPPLLGQHTDDILRTLLGKSEAEIVQLRQNGVI
ncbi:MAG: CoA transferase [Anaerolineales bacterium]|nr:CoA transferase [Anaerolineales bacterium]